MLTTPTKLKKFEALILTENGTLKEAHGKGKHANDVKMFVWINFDNAEIIDLKWLEK